MREVRLQDVRRSLPTKEHHWPKMLDETKLNIVRSTWALAAANASTSQVFYANLFRVDPSTKPLFVGDLTLQGRKLTETLNFVVDHLDEPDALMPAAENLARRHLSYNVTKDQYTSVGDALIATFRQLLGSEFTPEAEQAWTETYKALVNIMIKAAYPS